jgi:hypothetical protein
LLSLRQLATAALGAGAVRFSNAIAFMDSIITASSAPGVRRLA